MDKKSLDEFFAQAEDVLTDWPIKNVNDVDVANTEDPGRYELGDEDSTEDGAQPTCPWCGHRHPSFTHLLDDLLAVVFFPPEIQGPELVVWGFDPAVGVVVLREDGSIEVVDTATGPVVDTPAGPLIISPESIDLSLADSRDENIDIPS